MTGRSLMSLLLGKHGIYMNLIHAVCVASLSTIGACAHADTPTHSDTPAHTAAVIPYPAVPGASQSALYSVRVGGHAIFVEHFKDLHVARFSIGAPSSVEVRVSDSVGDVTIGPRAAGISVRRDGSTFTFQMSTARPLMVMPTGAEKLILLADPPERDPPRPGEPDVIDVRTFVNTDSPSHTEGIRAALNAAAQRKRATVVYFPDGRYVTGGLSLPDQVSVYLAAGALLEGTGAPADYPPQDRSAGALLLLRGWGNRIFGRGVIDAKGKALRDAGGDRGRVKILRTLGARDLRVEDLLLRDAGSWAVHLVGSQRLRLTNVKILNDPGLTNGDGIDPDGSQDVVIDRAFIHTTDDCFALKTTGHFGSNEPLSDVTVRRSACWTKKSALKVGTETRAVISGVTFEDNDVLHADRAVTIYLDDGAPVCGVRFLRTNVDSVGGDARERLIDIRLKGTATINDITIDGLVARQPAPQPSTIEGLDPAHQVVGVRLRNLVIAGQAARRLEDVPMRVNSQVADLQLASPAATEPGWTQVVGKAGRGCPETTPAAPRRQAPRTQWNHPRSSDRHPSREGQAMNPRPSIGPLLFLDAYGVGPLPGLA